MGESMDMEAKTSEFAYRFRLAGAGARLNFTAQGSPGPQVERASFQVNLPGALGEAAERIERRANGVHVDLGYLPALVTASQTLGSTADTFKFSGASLTDFRLGVGIPLGDYFEVSGWLSRGSLAVKVLDSGDFLIQGSSASSIWGGGKIEQINAFSGGNELRLSVGVATERTYLLEFQSNTELALAVIPDVQVALGLSFRHSTGPVTRGSYLQISAGFDKGLGTGSTARTTWSSNEEYGASLLWHAKTSQALALELGLGITLRRNSFAIEGDSWTGSETATRATVGFSYEFLSGKRR